MNTTATAKKGWGQKNEMEQCKKRDCPISPSDPQASTNTAAAAPHIIFCEFCEHLIGVWGAGVAATDNRNDRLQGKQADTLP
jgi:hypothetical protein